MWRDVGVLLCRQEAQRRPLMAQMCREQQALKLEWEQAWSGKEPPGGWCGCGRERQGYGEVRGRAN